MQQNLLFQSPSKLESLSLADASVSYMPNFLKPDDANELYQKFCAELAWRQDSIKMYGKSVKIPRLQAWYGDPEAAYRYSGLEMIPIPWTLELLSLKKRIEQLTGAAFNSVLANWYRDGQDSMGWHSDDEPELGVQPTIASVTLGQVRDFDFKHKHTGQKYRIALENGSLLLMAQETQKNWQHGIAKRTRPLNGRINLTFRQILTSHK